MRPDPFAIRADIVVDSANPASWRRARLRYEPTRGADRTEAEELVLNALVNATRLLTSGDVRELARGRHNHTDVSQALTRLMARGLVDYTPGPRNRRDWTVTPLGRRDGLYGLNSGDEDDAVSQPESAWPTHSEPAAL